MTHQTTTFQTCTGFSTHIVRRFDHFQCGDYIGKQPWLFYRTHFFCVYCIKSQHFNTNIRVQRTLYVFYLEVMDFAGSAVEDKLDARWATRTHCAHAMRVRKPRLDAPPVITEYACAAQLLATCLPLFRLVPSYTNRRIKAKR